MELNEYTQRAMTTRLPSADNIAYMFDNLLGEVGELIDKVNAYSHQEDLGNIADDLAYFSKLAKKVRKNPDDYIVTVERNHYERLREQLSSNEEIKKECGDILWQLAGFCDQLGWSLEEIAQMNLDKLAARKKNDTIDGNGDNR